MLNRLTKVTDWASKATTYTYDAAGNLLGFSHPNGATAAYQYDAASRLTSVTNKSGPTTLSSFTYALDKVGNRVQMVTSAGGVNAFGYDSLYRLTSWTAPSGQPTTWTYDAVGNRKAMVSSAGTTNYTYDVADELLTAGTSSLTYDGNGNQLTKTTAGTTITYGWDALNRLISASGGGISTQYQYDGDGDRVSQQIATGTYAYLNDPATELPVVLNENGPDGNIDYLCGRSMISLTSSAFQYYHQFDGLGSTSNLTDSTGVQKANYSYDPWGKLTLPLDPASKDKYKFTGEAVNSSTGLVFLRARYYDSSLGRFNSRDPLAGTVTVPATHNRYQYVLSTPTLLSDPSGLSAIDGSSNNGQALGAFTSSSNTALRTLGINVITATSESGSFFPALIGEYLKSLGADLAATVTAALGQPQLSQGIQDVNTLTTPFAPSSQVGPASFRIADILVPIVTWPLKEIFKAPGLSLQ